LNEISHIFLRDIIEISCQYIRSCLGKAILCFNFVKWCSRNFRIPREYHFACIYFLSKVILMVASSWNFAAVYFKPDNIMKLRIFIFWTNYLFTLYVNDIIYIQSFFVFPHGILKDWSRIVWDIISLFHKFFHVGNFFNIIILVRFWIAN
jgi:hypothetical protein